MSRLYSVITSSSSMFRKATRHYYELKCNFFSITDANQSQKLNLLEDSWNLSQSESSQLGPVLHKVPESFYKYQNQEQRVQPAACRHHTGHQTKGYLSLFTSCMIFFPEINVVPLQQQQEKNRNKSIQHTQGKKILFRAENIFLLCESKQCDEAALQARVLSLVTVVAFQTLC